MLVVSYVVNGGIMLKQLPEPTKPQEQGGDVFFDPLDFDPLDTVCVDYTAEMDEAEIQKLLQELGMLSADTVSESEETVPI